MVSHTFPSQHLDEGDETALLYRVRHLRYLQLINIGYSFRPFGRLCTLIMRSWTSAGTCAKLERTHYGRYQIAQTSAYHRPRPTDTDTPTSIGKAMACLSQDTPMLPVTRCSTGQHNSLMLEITMMTLTFL